MPNSDVELSRDSLRRRMYISLTVVAALTILSWGFFFWQLSVLQRAFQDLKREDEQLVLALTASQQATSIVVVAQDKATDQVPDSFASNVGDLIRELQDRQSELTARQEIYATDPVAYERIGDVVSSLDEMINIAQGAVRHAEDENWPAVQVRVDLLTERQSDVERRTFQLVSMARDRRNVAEAQVAVSMGRIISISLPLVVVALILSIVITFIIISDVTLGMQQIGYMAQRLASGHFDERIPIVRRDELGRMAQAFNMMAGELQTLYTDLEQQVAERTAALERRTAQMGAAALVAQEAAAIRDVSQLLDRVVSLVSDRFGFYHAGVFLVDESGEFAVLRSASSDGGKRMLERAHKLRVGEEGIVGYVASAGVPRIALDVGEDAVYFDNPDLPLTRSEMGLPLAVRGRVIGVLDVQSVQEAAFSDEDVSVLQTMADHVALAIDNARLLEESQRAVQELETLYGRQARQAWEEQTAFRTPAFVYTGVEVEPASDIVLDEEDMSAQEQDVGFGGARRIVAPISLRGQVLGSIVLRQGQDEDKEPWVEDEIELVQEVSTQIGLALENARLLEESRQRAARERATGEIVAHVRQTLDVDMVLKTAVSEIRRALGLSKAVVRLAPRAEDRTE